MESSLDQRYVQERQEMVARQLAARDIVDPQVLDVMSRVPRHEFVPSHLREMAYGDHPLPLSDGQTISQPYIVALMTQLANIRPGARALEIGTGSGYQTAVLAELCAEVYSLEIVPGLARTAQARLLQLGYRNVFVREGDGALGWPEHAPYDVIVAAASPPQIPQPLVDQLALGGSLVLPIGDYHQVLTVIRRSARGDLERFAVTPVSFVPMVGQVRC